MKCQNCNTEFDGEGDLCPICKAETFSVDKTPPSVFSNTTSGAFRSDNPGIQALAGKEISKNVIFIVVTFLICVLLFAFVAYFIFGLGRN